MFLPLAMWPFTGVHLVVLDPRLLGAVVCSSGINIVISIAWHGRWRGWYCTAEFGACVGCASFALLFAPDQAPPTAFISPALPARS